MSYQDIPSNQDPCFPSDRFPKQVSNLPQNTTWRTLYKRQQRKHGDMIHRYQKIDLCSCQLIHCFWQHAYSLEATMLRVWMREQVNCWEVGKEQDTRQTHWRWTSKKNDSNTPSFWCCLLLEWWKAVTLFYLTSRRQPAIYDQHFIHKSTVLQRIHCQNKPIDYRSEISSCAAFEPLVEQIHYSKSQDQLEAQVGFGIAYGVPRLCDSLVI